MTKKTKSVDKKLWTGIQKYKRKPELSGLLGTVMEQLKPTKKGNTII